MTLRQCIHYRTLPWRHPTTRSVGMPCVCVCACVWWSADGLVNAEWCRVAGGLPTIVREVYLLYSMRVAGMQDELLVEVQQRLVERVEEISFSVFTRLRGAAYCRKTYLWEDLHRRRGGRYAALSSSLSLLPSPWLSFAFLLNLSRPKVIEIVSWDEHEAVIREMERAFWK